MKKLLILIILSISFIPSYSKAADTYTLLEPLPCISGVGNCKEGEMQKEIDINGYILYVYKFSIGLAVILAIVMIIWGGFEYMTSEVPFIKSDGKTKIQNAITGLAMVLVSYLILVTIDPRLVNIYSNIEPIKIPTKDLQEIAQYNNQKTIDFQEINAENQLKLLEMNRDINDISKELKDIDAKVVRGEIATKEEATVRKAELTSQLAETKINRIVLIAENTGAYSYSNAVSIMIDPAGREESLAQYTAKTVPDFVSVGSSQVRRTDSPNVIQNQYNEKINELIDNKQGFDKIKTLEKQRDFYITAVKEELELDRKIDTHRMLGINASGIPGSVDNSSYLNSKLTEYKSAIDSTQKQTSSGLSEDKYKNVYQVRIDRINNTLNKK